MIATAVSFVSNICCWRSHFPSVRQSRTPAKIGGFSCHLMGRMHIRVRYNNVLLAFVFLAHSSRLTLAGVPPSFVHIPFVGCESDGQLGPVKAPNGERKLVATTSEQGAHLSYYEAEGGLGVIAPRGWFCFGTYGSSGTALYVSPVPINRAEFSSSTWAGFTGSAVQITHEYGGTSGRFGVAAVIARVFPAYRDYVKTILAEGMQPGSFPSGPYPNDQLSYRSKNIVEYTTAPWSEGLGTRSRFAKNERAITGTAMLVGKAPDLILLAIRVPDSLASLRPAIVRQVENDAVQAGNK